MKKLICTFFAVVATISIAQSQNKTLTATQKSNCNDINYAYKMACEGYAEAEYIFANNFIGVDPYDPDAEIYRKYWEPYSTTDPLVCSAIWLKKACEHGWVAAYEEYADFCFYGRGKAEGGATEAIKWLQKVEKVQPNNLDVIANIGICYIESKNTTTGLTYLTKAINKFEQDSSLKISSGAYLFLATLYYYGCDVQQDKEKAINYIIDFFAKSFERFSDYDPNISLITLYEENLEKALVYYIHYINHGDGKNEPDKEMATRFLNNYFNVVFKKNDGKKFDMDWIDAKFLEYDKGNHCDFIILL